MGYLEDREQKAHQEYEATIAGAKAKLDRILSAVRILRENEGLDVVMLATDGPVQQVVVIEAKKTTSAKSPDTPSIPAMVKEALPFLKGEYEHSAVLEAVKDLHPEADLGDGKGVRDVLARLAQAKKGVEVVKPKYGKTAAIYRTLKEHAPASVAKSNAEKGPSVKTRTKEARVKLTGKYHRMDLYRATLKDGKGEFSRGTFGWIFADLVREGEIKVLEEAVGNLPAVYCNPDEYEKLKAESPTNVDLDLF